MNMDMPIRDDFRLGSQIRDDFGYNHGYVPVDYERPGPRYMEEYAQREEPFMHKYMAQGPRGLVPPYERQPNYERHQQLPYPNSHNRPQTGQPMRYNDQQREQQYERYEGLYRNMSQQALGLYPQQNIHPNDVRIHSRDPRYVHPNSIVQGPFSREFRHDQEIMRRGGLMNRSLSPQRMGYGEHQGVIKRGFEAQGRYVGERRNPEQRQFFDETDGGSRGPQKYFEPQQYRRQYQQY